LGASRYRRSSAAPSALALAAAAAGFMLFRLNDQQDRNAIIEGFAAAIRERAIEVTCFHSIGEYKAFITKTKGRAEAAAGAHDDDVLADCMAWEVLPSASEYRETKAQHVDPPDRHTWRKVNGVRRGW
jgi:hypothetical protein